MKKIGFIFVAVMLLAAGCSKKEEIESKNLEQIQNENGVPVKVKTMELEDFTKFLPYNATLTGYRQSHASAMMGGRIEKIHAKVGDQVEKDQILIEFPEDAPGGQYVQAKSALELAEKTYNRMKKLYDLGGISLQDLDQLETQYNVSKANFDAVSQMLKVRAPISGMVTNIRVHETDNVKAETVLVTITQTDKMKAKLWATEEEVCQIKKGMNVTAKWQDKVLSGKVKEVAIAMDIAHNAFGVDVVFDNSQMMCKSGVIGEILIKTYSTEAFVLPRKVVKEDNEGKYIFKVKSDKAVKSYITTGNENGSYEIVSGILAGDAVIMEGFSLVSDGKKVKIVK